MNGFHENWLIESKTMRTAVNNIDFFTPEKNKNRVVSHTFCPSVSETFIEIVYSKSFNIQV